jgi:hypothetical protein
LAWLFPSVPRRKFARRQFARVYLLQMVALREPVASTQATLTELFARNFGEKFAICKPLRRMTPNW